MICDAGGGLTIGNGVTISLLGPNSCIASLASGTLTMNKNLTINNGLIRINQNSQANINNSMTFSGNSYLKVDPGATLKMGTGTNLTFNSNASLEVIGTPTNNARFTSADGTPNRKDWGTIFLYGNNNRVEYCVIEGSDWGLKFYGPSSGNVVRNCTFRQNDQAVRMEYTDADVTNCLIENNRHAFVLINNTSQYGNIYLDGNTVRNNDRDGIYAVTSVADVFRSTLDNNGTANTSTYNGIYAITSSDVALGLRNWNQNLVCSGGFNTIKNSHGTGVYVNISSLVLLGDKTGSSLPSYRAGNNAVHNNGTYSGTFSGKEVYNLTGTTVQANKIYWNGTPTSAKFSGPIDYAEWLTSPPSGSCNPPTLVYSPNNGEAKIEAPAQDIFTMGDEDTNLKRALIDSLRAVIAHRPASVEAGEALQIIFSYIRTDWENKLGERQGIYAYLSSLERAYRQLALGKRAKQLMIIERLGQNDFAAAMTLAQNALSDFSGELRQETMSLLIMLLMRTGNVAQAQQLFEIYKVDYPAASSMQELLQGMFNHIAHDLANAVPLSGGLSRPSLDHRRAQTEIPAEFSLAQNFPNPFNPATAIRFALPRQGKVVLQIFNTRGEQVRTLLSEIKPAGEHTVLWNGKNNRGDVAASGIYFYQFTYLPLESPENTIIRRGKMSLVQ